MMVDWLVDGWVMMVSDGWFLVFTLENILDVGLTASWLAKKLVNHVFIF